MAKSPANGLNIEFINPALDYKFSPNLYAWLTAASEPTRAWSSRVYQESSGVFWVGLLTPSVLYGARLLDVLDVGAEEPTTTWPGLKAIEVVGFWGNYMNEGLCALDVDHVSSFHNDELRWQKPKYGSSLCRWCGQFKRSVSDIPYPVSRQS